MGLGVFHPKGWWPKSSCPASKVCLPSGSSERGRYRRGRSEIPHFPSKLQSFALVLGKQEKKRRKSEEKRRKTKKNEEKRKKNEKNGKIPPTPSTPTPLRTSQFLGIRREESGMTREFCRDVPDPWGCSKSLCQKNSSREKLYTPPPPLPPFLAKRHFSRGGGWGCIS